MRLAACIPTCKISLKTLGTKIYPRTDLTRRIGRCLAKVEVVVGCKMEALEDGEAFYKRQAFREVGVELPPGLEGWPKVQVIHANPTMRKILLECKEMDKGAEIPRHTSSTAFVRCELGAADADRKAIPQGATAGTVQACLATTTATYLSWAIPLDPWV